MPYRNRSIKSYANCIYHVYARGINKSLIYYTDEDKRYFLYLLKRYLTPNFKEKIHYKGQIIEVDVNSVASLIELQAYCLMDNHFHMLIYCKEDEGIERLMRRILSVYSNYFNKKYNRQGNLFQGSYRSVLITNEWQLHVIGVYIHINPERKHITIKEEFSSNYNYCNKKETAWLKLNNGLSKDIDFYNLKKYYDLLNISEKEAVQNGILL